MSDDAGEEVKHSLVRPDALSPEALQALMEEFVSRDGTDYGLAEKSLKEKVDRLRDLLDSGAASIVFDHVTESVTILTTRDL
jgi:uncharacterized protein YheU (UPF0270 family)